MTGANYMGGKRNAARARTKDSTGRVQKRHFGQQRLAAALCYTKEGREKPEKMSLKSVLHQINLAHAQRDAKIKGNYPSTAHGISTSCDTPFADGISFGTPKRHKQPSKILRMLDFSDPVAYRDAIDRILSIPLSEMIELPLQGKSSHSDSEDGGPCIDPEEHLLLPIDADSESDVQFQGTFSDTFSRTGRSSGSASHLFPIDNDNDGGIYDDHLSGRMLRPPSPDHRMVTTYESPLRSVETDSFHGSWVNDSGYADTDIAETGKLRGSVPTHDLQEEYILNMDTSPPSSQNSLSQLHGGWSSNHGYFSQRSPSSSTSPIGFPAPIVTHDSPESFGWDSSIKCSSPISQSLCHTSDVKQFSASSFETQYAPTTPQKARKMFHATQISEAIAKPFTEIFNTGHRRSVQNSYLATRTKHVESHSFNSSQGFSSFGGSDIHDPGLPLDILNDPDPWSTIGKILNLETVEQHDNDDITFTRGREGVGYVRHRLDGSAYIWNTPRNSTISLRSVKSESEDQPKARVNDEEEEHSGETTDHCRHHSQHSEGSKPEEKPSPDHSNLATNMKFANEPRCRLTVAESEMQIEPFCVPTALAHRVSPQDVQCSGIDDDDLYGGPCLFGDSDEENE
ncbi:uncharacterized protein F5891DRAFT_1069136 [Suillus fuscotomentosus]|uniref:Uncharacterized protein n=1 Tax=Suillus fuscotomentosus TaxID=1912939 RepID=A0AAD4DT31_9AGAM|nr:uncharacterized protein F5891DRAFT_1069136 [Suillus fuscotomentosus]KAG1891754.1 hypothetical protein F5891DRAFT_1069136 [Suillus fuscotomentosus]